MIEVNKMDLEKRLETLKNIIEYVKPSSCRVNWTKENYIGKGTIYTCKFIPSTNLTSVYFIKLCQRDLSLTLYRHTESVEFGVTYSESEGILIKRLIDEIINVMESKSNLLSLINAELKNPNKTKVIVDGLFI